MTRRTFEATEKEVRDWYYCRLLRQQQPKGFVVETMTNTKSSFVRTLDQAVDVAKRWELEFNIKTGLK